MRGHFYAAISPSEKYSPPRKHVKRLKMLKSLCPAVALALTLFFSAAAPCPAVTIAPFYPHDGLLPRSPHTEAFALYCGAPSYRRAQPSCHIIAELMLSSPHLLSVVTLVLPLCVVSLNFCSAAVPVLPPNYRRACTSLWHVILRRVYFLLPRCSLSPRSAVALALSPLHLP